MKKLVTAACALAAGLALANGGVQSANVVGYQTATSQAGFNWIAPDFVSIGGNSSCLGMIRLDENGISYTDNIQILDPLGNTLVKYSWVDEEEEYEDENGNISAGWLDGKTDELVNDVVLARGSSILLSAKSANVIITRAGEVSTNDVVISSVSGFNWVGNAFPVQGCLGKIKLGATAQSYTDNIQILDTLGNTIAKYSWVDEEEEYEDENGNISAGWLDGKTDELVNSMALSAGAGLIISTKSANTTITISPNL